MKQEIKDVLENPVDFHRTFFKIANKERKVVRFIANKVQTHYEQNYSNRDIVLKYRQPGFSSWVLGRMLMECIVEKNTNCVVISHEDEATQRLLQKVKFFIEHLPLPVSLEYESVHQVKFKKQNSSIYVGTAGKRAFGRGDNLHFVHCSEVAQWRNPVSLLSGVEEAVAKTGRIVIETTANGIGTWFYKFWKKAERKQSGWNPIFYPWPWSPEYSLTEKEYVNLLRREFGELTDEDKDFQKKYNLTLDQMRWRRWKLLTMTEPILFPQEYPMTPDEAFVSKADCVFDKKIIARLTNNAPAPIRIVTADWHEKKFIDSPNGKLSIWKPPVAGHRYVMGGDCGAGVEKGDFSCADMYDVDEKEQVAQWHGIIEPDIFAEIVNVFCMIYNTALAVIERNNCGPAVLLKLWNDLAYPNVYTEKRFDTGLQKETRKLGIFTSAKTKNLMVTKMKELMRKGLKIYSQVLLQEMSVFIYKLIGESQNSWRMEAEQGAHDDCVMASVVAALVIDDELPLPPTPEETISLSLKDFLDKSKSKDRYKYKVGNF